MSGPGRPTLYKPEHASRAREFCARGATNPDLAGRFGVARNTAIERERTLWGDSKTSGGKGGKGGNLQSLANSGLFDDGATWRKPAETGGNPLQKLCSRNCRQFDVSSKGCTPARDWQIACGNCGNSRPLGRLEQYCRVSLA
jgi:hypothetical protein